ncbi:hypothetical protein [Ochrobactrum quorumnocens]|uniref:Uncharacterized protein n=1 Tax=Ochrobactrum quorumnocens TaxID=271865 RepID=A0A5N1JVQ8_9HYPH|nr:hypothetical protein [[Ochrobactrum] quorumnocens]KAA9361188.1 hypothetical protein F3W84_21420 [[Ochrobactrum] quorumnocens]MBD7993293.1 hypothetical protein [Ochrobactrum gallinarum]
MLEWIGCVHPDEVKDVADKLLDLISRASVDNSAKAGVTYKNYIIRPLLMIGADYDKDFRKLWRLNAGVVFPFIQSRLAKDLKPDSCSRDYGADQWTGEYKDLVEWFKEQGSKEIKMEDFHERFPKK